MTDQNDTPAELATVDTSGSGSFPLHPDATEAACKAARAYVEQVVQDSVAAMNRRRDVVALTISDVEIRYVARIAARLAVGLSRNPDRRSS